MIDLLGTQNDITPLSTDIISYKSVLLYLYDPQFFFASNLVSQVSYDADSE